MQTTTGAPVSSKRAVRRQGVRRKVRHGHARRGPPTPPAPLRWAVLDARLPLPALRRLAHRHPPHRHRPALARHNTNAAAPP